MATSSRFDLFTLTKNQGTIKFSVKCPTGYCQRIRMQRHQLNYSKCCQSSFCTPLTLDGVILVVVRQSKRQSSASEQALLSLFTNMLTYTFKQSLPQCAYVSNWIIPGIATVVEGSSCIFLFNVSQLACP